MCPKCAEVVPHRTLYVKIESAGRSKWFGIFRVCTKCLSLNTVIFPRFRLESVPSVLPSQLAWMVVNALKDAPLDCSEIVTHLRRPQVRSKEHVLKLEVLLVLEYLRKSKVVGENKINRTGQILQMLRSRGSESKHLGPCPAELRRGCERRRLISLYVQRWTAVKRDGHESPIQRKRSLPAGVLCLSCLYHDLDQRLVR